MEARTYKVRFYSNGTEEDKKALRLLRKENIPYVNLGPISEKETPIIRYGFWEYFGLEAIQRFISGWKLGRLPPLKA